MKIVQIFTLLTALATSNACRKDEDSSSGPAKASSTQKLGNAYGETAVTQQSAIVISTNKVVALKQIPKVGGGAADPAREDFRLGLYVKVKQYCTPCHAGQNAFPFASPGLDLAYAAAKKYVTADPAQSKMILNINSGHNGSQAAWAAEFAPTIQSLAAKLAAAPAP